MKQKLLNSMKLRATLLVAILCSLFTGTAWADDVTLTISTYASSNSWTNGTAYSSIAINSDLSATCTTGGNNGKYYSSNQSWRHYEGDNGSVIITTTSGTLNSITFNYVSGNSGVLIYNDSNVISGTECSDVDGETSVTFTVGHSSGTKKGNVQITSIVISYTPAGGGGGSTTYTVTYDGNGNTSGDVPEDDNEYEENEEVTVLGQGTLAKLGNAFAGWNTEDDGTGDSYDENDTFEITENTTLYAQWSPKTISTLTFTGTPTKTAYNGGENFNPAGLEVTATYDDASEEDVTTAVAWTPSPLTSGTTQVTGTFMGKTITVTGLTVTAAPGSAEDPYTVAEAIYAIDNSGNVSDVYVAGIVSQVDSYNSTYNSITYWISDDGTTTNQFEVYGGLSFDGGTAFSSKDDIQVGDVVVVKGNITYYAKNSVYEFSQNNHLVSQKLVAPTFYPAAGAVGSGTELTITDNHPGSTIYYTTDGSTPTTSSTAYNPSSKPTITAATTFKAIAVKTGDTNDNFVNSDDASASYTLLTPAETPVITLAGGTYSSTQSTTITCETAGATIYYTTDGTAPTTSSTEYSGAISINESMTIKAIAAKDGMANSAVATATYTISIPAINAANVNITCEDTEGSIAYTITNPDGGALTAEITGGNSGSWLTLGAVSASAVAFTCTTNSDEVNARTTTVTLTYTYDTDKTVTKDVTVTQAKHEEVIAPAVAGVGAFVKVTDNDDITNGTYLIVYEGDATHDAVAFDGSLTTLDAAKNTIKVNIIDDKIESSAATAAATFEIRPESGTIKSKSNKYIGNTSNSNALTASDSELTNTFDIPTESNTNNNVDIVSSGGAYLRYNKSSGQERFRYFKSGTYSSQQAIALYKYDATETPFATAKLNSEGYATFSSAAKIDLSSTSGFTAWQITGISGETITFGKVTSVVPVGTGLLLWGNANEVVELTVTDDAAFALSSNWLVGTPTATDVAEGEAYGLSGDKFVVNNADGKIPAGRAYLPAASIPNEVKSFTFVFEDTETGITETRTATRGEVEAIFNLAGQRLSKMQKGINIVNGKKVLVK